VHDAMDLFSRFGMATFSATVGRTGERAACMDGGRHHGAMTDGKPGEKTQCWPSFPLRSRQSKRRIHPQSFDNFRHEFLDSRDVQKAIARILP